MYDDEVFERTGSWPEENEFRHQFRQYFTIGRELRSIRCTYEIIRQSDERRVQTRNSKKGSRVFDSHRWRVASRLLARYRAGEDIPLREVACGTSISCMMCIYQSITYALEMYGICRLTDLRSQSMRILRDDNDHKTLITPCFKSSLKSSGTTFICANAKAVNSIETPY